MGIEHTYSIFGYFSRVWIGAFCIKRPDSCIDNKLNIYDKIVSIYINSRLGEDNVS